MSARRASRGFSLLEAAAAIALLGLALPAILAGFSDTISHVAAAEDRLNTLRRAQDLIVLARAEFRGLTGLRAGSDAVSAWTVETARLSSDERPNARDSARPIPIRVAVVIRSKRGAEARLDTLFLFDEPVR